MGQREKMFPENSSTVEPKPGKHFNCREKVFKFQKQLSVLHESDQK